MTDRNATELKGNMLLREDNDDNDSDFEFNEFNCSAHPLIQFASEAENVVKLNEQEEGVQFEKLFRNKGESLRKPAKVNI